ncbi:hypothetical protein BJ170DRAFT_316110 [Xylariales sp. AK1849]|nr:hypothetical protein BJ170DRAFT_316110 [Xylariales sp. AK1849]
MSTTTAASTSRYEIRKLDESHIEWALAITSHSNTFHSPMWTPLLRGSLTLSCYTSFKVDEYIIRHQILSGHSLGAFDREYSFKRGESEATGGKLWWNLDDETAGAEQLLEQMDFPLVSVALAYDAMDPLDMALVAPSFEAFPGFATTVEELTMLDTREPATWEASKPGELLLRSATSTRAEYEGRGLMKLLAHDMMARAAQQEFRAIQIESTHPAVTHVWEHPPPPFKGVVVAQLHTKTFSETDDKGEKTYPFSDADVVLSRCYVTLR